MSFELFAGIGSNKDYILKIGLWFFAQLKNFSESESNYTQNIPQWIAKHCKKTGFPTCLLVGMSYLHYLTLLRKKVELSPVLKVSIKNHLFREVSSRAMAV